VIEALQRDGEIRQALPWLARQSGIVSELNIRHGMFVEPGDPLLAMVDLSSVWVIADVFDRHVRWLEVGQPAEIALAYNGGAVASQVAHIYPQLDAVTRTVQVRLPVANPNQALKPGMWSTVRIVAEPATATLLIPREALIRTGHGERVIVRRDAQRFEVRDVEAGSEAGEQVEILHGLGPGDEVVVSGQFLLDSEAALGPARHRLEGMDPHQFH
jgi:membrane fusion protein, copper/silver efflux system